MAFLLIPIFLILFYLFVFYNFITSLRGQMIISFDQLHKQLEAYFTIIPRLTGFIRSSGYSEMEMTQAFQTARSLAKTAHTPYELALVYSNMEHGVSRLRYIARQNPALAANDDYISLNNQLINHDEKIQFALAFYHEKMERYNRAVLGFPGRMAANIFRFGYWAPFEADSRDEDE